MSQQKLAKDSEIVVPPLKWAGGKRWLVKNYSQAFPKEFRTYIEPFLGSGAVFFSLRPNRAILADTNQELVDFYISIKQRPTALHRLLEAHHRQHCTDYYYQVRDSQPRSRLERAARFLYLNRTCWNGLYRVNRKGDFNVPIGTKKEVVLPTDDFKLLSRILSKQVSITTNDFEETLARAKHNDFAFVDPPYTVAHNNNGFVKYNQRIFSWDDQIRLRNTIAASVSRGAKVLVTNANHSSVRALYKGLGRIRVLDRASVISGPQHGRGRYEEILIQCY